MKFLFIKWPPDFCFHHGKPQGIRFHKGTENFRSLKVHAWISPVFLMKLYTWQVGMYWENTATPGRTLSLQTVTKATNSQLRIATSSSLHKVRFDDLLKHNTHRINSEWKENPTRDYLSAYGLLPYEAALCCFPPSLLSFPYWLGIRESRINSPPAMCPPFKYLPLNDMGKIAEGANSERSGWKSHF